MQPYSAPTPTVFIYISRSHGFIKQVGKMYDTSPDYMPPILGNIQDYYLPIAIDGDVYFATNAKTGEVLARYRVEKPPTPTAVLVRL